MAHNAMHRVHTRHVRTLTWSSQLRVALAVSHHHVAHMVLFTTMIMGCAVSGAPVPDDSDDTLHDIVGRSTYRYLSSSELEP